LPRSAVSDYPSIPEVAAQSQQISRPAGAHITTHLLLLLDGRFGNTQSLHYHPPWRGQDSRIATTRLDYACAGLLVYETPEIRSSTAVIPSRTHFNITQPGVANATRHIERDSLGIPPSLETSEYLSFISSAFQLVEFMS
jgi:hypothetical protein